jgi:hypothetical protein
VGIGSEKSILNRVLCVSCIAQNAVCPSIQRRQATSENLLQLLSGHLFTSNFLAFVRHAVCVSVLHALFPNPAKVFATRASIATSFELEFGPFHRLLVSLDSCLRGELVVSPHMLCKHAARSLIPTFINSRIAFSLLLVDGGDMFHLNDDNLLLWCPSLNLTIS